MSHPKVSIVIATFNRREALVKAIASVLSQNYRNIELVIVNDCSTDDTRTYLESLSNDPRFNIIHNELNSGLQKSLNIGINEAKGLYIARLDDDDIWTDEDKLNKQVNFLETNSDFGLVGTAYRIGDEEFANPESDFEIRKQILFRCPFRHSTVMFRKRLWQECGTYNEALKYSEDWDLWLKMGMKAKFANICDVTVEISEGDNLTSQYFTKQFPINRRIVGPYYNQYPNGFRARLYHWFLAVFFSLFPVGSLVHRFFQKVFAKTFSISKE